MVKKFYLPVMLLLILMFQMLTSVCVFAREYYYDDAWHPYVGEEFKLEVDGKILDTSMPPIVFDGYSVVPAREVFEHLGAKVLWDGDDASVTISYKKTEIVLIINSKYATIGKEKVKMPIAPKIINEKTMIPVRFVAEEMGWEVDFDTTRDTVIINSNTTPEESKIRLEKVDWELNRVNTRLTIALTTDEDEPEFTHFALKSPSRIVIDIPYALNKTGKDGITIDQKNVDKLRIGQQVDATRIVIDLTQDSHYTAKAVGNEIRIQIVLETPVATASPSPSAKPTTTPKPSIKPTNPNADATATPSASPKPSASAKPSASPSPSTSPKPTGTPPPIARYVTIDAGHGGVDPGAIYTEADEESEDFGKVTAKEKDINLAVALLVKEKLEKEDVRVHMIRKTDVYVNFLDVGAIANEKGTSLFVSIHTNSAESSAAHGIETWGFLDGGADYAGMTSARLSKNVLDAVIKATGAHNRGVKDGKNLAVIHTSQMPATLIELGFISNKEDREKMMTDSYREILAEAIAEGILKSLEEMGL